MITELFLMTSKIVPTLGRPLGISQSLVYFLDIGYSLANTFYRYLNIETNMICQTILSFETGKV